MNKDDRRLIRQMLLKERQTILQRLQRRESSLRELGAPEIEFEEEAQKASLIDLQDRLDLREQEEITAIDQALVKLSTGTYGLCEECGKAIAVPRLVVLPTARLCHHCASAGENQARPSAAAEPPRLGDSAWPDDELTLDEEDSSPEELAIPMGRDEGAERELFRYKNAEWELHEL